MTDSRLTLQGSGTAVTVPADTQDEETKPQQFTLLATEGMVCEGDFCDLGPSDQETRRDCGA